MPVRPLLRVLCYNDLESVYDDPDQIGHLAGLIKDLGDSRTLLVGAGDNTALGALTLFHDESRQIAREFFDTVQPDAETFGNHEFELESGWTGAINWANSVPPTYCCANINVPKTDSVPASTVIDRGGIEVGIVGVVHPETASICGAASDFEFGDPVEAAARELKTLRSHGVDYLIILSHGGEHDYRIAAETEADLVVGGHIHRRRLDHIDGTILVRTGGGGEALAEVILNDEPSVTFHEPQTADKDESVTRTYRRYCEEVGINDVVATIEKPLCRPDADRFDGESRVGNFVADAYRHGIDADLALVPAGAIRNGPSLSDAVTVGQVVSISPFSDRLCELEMTGAELREALADAASSRPSVRGWVHLHVSGAQILWNADGSISSLRVNGKSVRDDQTYRVATIEWLINVADGYGPNNPENIIAKHGLAHEHLISYARNGELTKARCEGRIQKI